MRSDRSPPFASVRRTPPPETPRTQTNRSIPQLPSALLAKTEYLPGLEITSPDLPALPRGDRQPGAVRTPQADQVQDLARVISGVRQPAQQGLRHPVTLPPDR